MLLPISNGKNGNLKGAKRSQKKTTFVLPISGWSPGSSKKYINNVVYIIIQRYYLKYESVIFGMEDGI